MINWILAIVIVGGVNLAGIGFAFLIKAWPLMMLVIGGMFFAVLLVVLVKRKLDS